MLRPQPLGIFPLPAGFLLLPTHPVHQEALHALLQGRRPQQWPASLRFFEAALNGDLEQAITLLHDDATPEAAYNRFVLAPAHDDYRTLSAQASPALRAVLDVAAYTVGLIDALPDPAALDGEIAAFVLLAQSAAALEQDALTTAVDCLQRAIAVAQPVSPIFAAQLTGALAELLHQRLGQPEQAAVHYRQAVRILAQTDLVQATTEMQVAFGMCLQEIAGQHRGLLLEAVRAYQAALRRLTLEVQPELYALTHNNLALAYLAMPMTQASDQLRMGVAVQSLREALKVFRQDTHPKYWAKAQINLANALQYLPSAHAADNLVEAVECYERVLEAGVFDTDALDYARLLANQGNALAHLGIHAQAIVKLERAQTLFLQHGEIDHARTVAETLTAIRAIYQPDALSAAAPAS